MSVIDNREQNYIVVLVLVTVICAFTVCMFLCTTFISVVVWMQYVGKMVYNGRVTIYLQLIKPFFNHKKRLDHIFKSLSENTSPWTFNILTASVYLIIVYIQVQSRSYSDIFRDILYKYLAACHRRYLSKSAYWIFVNIYGKWTV